MSQTSRPLKRFAPLSPQKDNVFGAPTLKGIVFDVDGTLWYVPFIEHVEFHALSIGHCEASLDLFAFVFAGS